MVTLAPGVVFRALPAGADVVILETHSVEPFPTIVSEMAEPAEGEQVDLDRIDNLLLREDG